MLSEAFYWLLNMSIAGGVTGFIVLALRQVKKIPRNFIYALWVIPLIRFTLPFGLSGPYNLMTLISKYATKIVLVYKVQRSVCEITSMNSISLAYRYFPIEYKTNVLEEFFNISSLVWIIISIALVLTALKLYHFTRREIKTAELLRDNIYISDRVTSPVLYGIFKLKIMIPLSLKDDDLDYIIMHEKVHIKRRDNLWRGIAIFICCIHWFNPICWLCLKYFLEDMELSCDCRVLKKLEGEETKKYALAILNTTAGKNLFLSAFGGAKVKIRLENVLSYKKLTWMSALAFGTLITVIILLLVTNASS